MLKRILFTAMVLLLLIIGLLLYGSMSKLPPEDYYRLKAYNTYHTHLSKDTLTILTYNLGYLSGMTNNRPVKRTEELFNANLESAKQLLRKLDADIIVFQEIDFGSSRSYFRHQLDSLVNTCNYKYAYQSVNWDKRYVPFPYWPPSMHFGEINSGQAIVSKYPIKNAQTIRLTKPVNTFLFYNIFYLDRLVQLVDVVVNNTTIKVMNVHLEAFDDETRVLQSQKVGQLYDNYNTKMPVLLLGDFNSRPPVETDRKKAMEEILSHGPIVPAINEEIYMDSPEKFYTFNSDSPYQKIDHILYNPQFFKVLEARVVNEAGTISDHLPVLAKFKLRIQNDKKERVNH